MLTEEPVDYYLVSDSESSIVDKRGSGTIDWACDEEGDEDGQSRDPGTPPGSPPPSVQPRTPTLAHGGCRPRVEGPCQLERLSPEVLARVASQLPPRERADALVALACASRSLRAMVAQHARPVRLSVRCGCNARDADIRAELGAAVEALGSGARIALVEVTEGPATLCKTGSGLVSLPSLPSAGPSLLSSLHSPSSSSCSSAAAASPSFLQWLADLLRGVAVEALSLETSSRDLLALQRLFRLPAADLVLALTAPPPQLALRALRVRRLTVGTGGGSTTVRVRDMPALERLAAGVLRWGRGEGARLRLLVEDGLPRLAAIENRSRRITTTWPLEDEPDTGASALHLLCNPPALRVVRWGQVFWGGAPPPALCQLSTPLPGAAVPRHVLAALGALECGAEDSGSGWLTTARGYWPGGLRELHLRVRLPADWDELLRHGLEGLSGLRRLALTINPVAAFTPRAPELTEAVVRARLQCPQPAHVVVRYARSSF